MRYMHYMRYMTTMILLVLALAGPGAAGAATPPWQAGLIRLSVADPDGAFDTLVFYPTDEPEAPWQAGPYTVEATRGAALAKGARWPVVLLSHGRGGSPLGHRELATALARAGFVVVLPTHLGDAAAHPRAPSQAQILVARPRQAESALNAVLADARFAAAVDPARVGMIGYSAGGYTALILAGAKPDFAAAQAYCADHADIGSCPRQASAASTAQPGPLAQWQPVADARIKALVLMDPLAVMFTSAGLSAVHVPTLLYRPEDDSYLGAARNAQAVADGVPGVSAVRRVPGRHFVFIDPCPAAVAAEAEQICRDAPGVDRVAIHRDIEHSVIDFLRARL